LASVLQKLKDSGKKLIFVSNSPFWYVDAGMRYVIGPDWRTSWDVVIVSAGKPSFYTDNAKPFREVSSRTGRVKFKKVSQKLMHLFFSSFMFMFGTKNVFFSVKYLHCFTAIPRLINWSMEKFIRRDVCVNLPVV
jgi:hypothetical protein